MYVVIIYLQYKPSSKGWVTGAAVGTTNTFREVQEALIYCIAWCSALFRATWPTRCLSVVQRDHLALWQGGRLARPPNRHLGGGLGHRGGRFFSSRTAATQVSTPRACGH